MLIELLLTNLIKYIDNGYKRIRNSNDSYTIVIYEVVNKENVPFTRIDIFTKQAKDAF